jgi:hypothetical protein
VPLSLTPVKQDAHPHQTIGEGDQTDDLEQDLPVETCRKVLRDFLNPTGLVAHGFPRK